MRSGRVCLRNGQKYDKEKPRHLLACCIPGAGKILSGIFRPCLCPGMLQGEELREDAEFGSVFIFDAVVP